MRRNLRHFDEATISPIFYVEVVKNVFLLKDTKFLGNIIITELYGMYGYSKLVGYA